MSRFPIGPATTGIYVWTGLSFSLLWFSGVSLFAFLGALLAIGLVYGLTRMRRSFSTTTLLLAGVGVITPLLGGPFFLWLLLGRTSPRGALAW